MTVYVHTPRLRGGFLRLDPATIPDDEKRSAAGLSNMDAWAEPVDLSALPQLDAIVTGSVAVTRTGRRCGKGEGYSDLEFAILRELGHAPVPVATTVHPLQGVESLPTDAHLDAMPVLAELRERQHGAKRALHARPAPGSGNKCACGCVVGSEPVLFSCAPPLPCARSPQF